MSYSRWSNSIWYTFWSSNSPKGINKKKEQIFEICDFPSYHVIYQQIVDDIDKVIYEVNEYYSKEHNGQIFDGIEDGEFKYVPHVWGPKNPSDEELQELKEYMLQFVADMDEHFKFFNYIKYEFYYPARNKIYWKFKKIYKSMKKLFLLLMIAFVLSSCASHVCHGVGDTPQSRDSKNAQQKQLRKQFP
jgi:hypothetical protein